MTGLAFLSFLRLVAGRGQKVLWHRDCEGPVCVPLRPALPLWFPSASEALNGPSGEPETPQLTLMRARGTMLVLFSSSAEEQWLFTQAVVRAVDYCRGS